MCLLLNRQEEGESRGQWPIASDSMRTPLDASQTSLVGQPLRILVCDDFAPFGSPSPAFFSTASMTIVGEAADGVAAIEMAVRLAPRVIIMDVIMPRMSGIEATRRIKRILQTYTSLAFPRSMTLSSKNP